MRLTLIAVAEGDQGASAQNIGFPSVIRVPGFHATLHIGNAVLYDGPLETGRVEQFLTGLDELPTVPVETRGFTPLVYERPFSKWGAAQRERVRRSMSDALDRAVDDLTRFKAGLARLGGSA